jgi:RNA polymerase-associated protein CTR9
MLLAILTQNEAKKSKSLNTKKKLTKEANQKVLEAYKLNPRNSLCNLQMAERFMDKDLHKALVMVKTALAHCGQELKAEALTTYGRILHAQEDYDQAFEKFTEAQKNNPDSAIIKFSLSQLLIKRNEHDKAASQLESILEKHPDDYDSLKLLFIIYANFNQKDNFEKAQKVLGIIEKLLKVKGVVVCKDEELLSEFAMFLENVDIQQSRKYYHELVQLLESEQKQVSPELLNNLAVLYHLEAEEIKNIFNSDYRKNYRVDVRGTDEANLESALEASEGLYQQALVAVSGIQVDKDYAIRTTIRYNVARLFESTGQVEKAQTHYEEILKSHPAYDDCLLRLGVIESSKENHANALEYFSDSLALNPQNSRAWFLIGNHYLKLKNYRSSRKSFEKVLEVNRYDVYALCSVGNLCLIFARGDPDPKTKLLHYSRAVEYFCKTLSLEPKNVHAAAGIGIAYAETHKLKEASLVFSQIMEIAPGDSNLTLLASHSLVENGQLHVAIPMVIES